MPSGLEERIGYHFRDKSLLQTALTHRSYFNENPNTSAGYNERLEFLGDSVLGLAVSEHLFTAYGGYSEAILAKFKSRVVMGKVLGEIASEISLGEHILLGRGEEESGGRQKDSILENSLEALVGAIFMDGGYEEAKGLVLRLFVDKIASIVENGEFRDYKTELQEVSQNRIGGRPVYKLAAEEGRDHEKTFIYEVFLAGESYGRGTGRSKKEAEARAAREALKKLAEQD